MKSILFLGILGLTLSSCVTDHDVVPIIPFKDIVGNYNGLSKICTAPNTNSDTLCNIGINNSLKVIVENLNNIRLTDATSQFVNQSLTFQKSEQISGEKNHFFSGQKDVMTLNLIFNEKNGNLKFESVVNTDGVIKTDYFIGTKK
jgi:hypothetical protein